MWFKKSKKEEVKENTVKKDDAMSKMIDEVLNEQAEAKEEAMRESADAANPAAAAAAEKSQTIADVIVKFRENQSQETFQAVLNALFPSNLLLTMTPIEGSENKEEKTVKATPALVKDQDGNKLLPAFSDKEQIPKEHSEKFQIVSVPFGAVCELTARIPDCDKIIVNPFTNAFVVSKEIVENIAKAVAEQRKKP